jgi:hypothetical protein
MVAGRWHTEKQYIPYLHAGGYLPSLTWQKLLFSKLFVLYCVLKAGSVGKFLLPPMGVLAFVSAWSSMDTSFKYHPNPIEGVPKLSES